MVTYGFYLGIFVAVIVAYTIAWSLRYNKQLKIEAKERAMNYYRNHFQEKLGPEGHFISLTRAGNERNWLLLDGGFEVQGNAHDIYPDDGLMEEGLAQMDTPERTLEWYRKNFLHECRLDGSVGGERYSCLSLDAGQNYFYINNAGIFKGWMEDFPQFARKQELLEKAVRLRGQGKELSLSESLELLSSYGCEIKEK